MEILRINQTNHNFVFPFYFSGLTTTTTTLIQPTHTHKHTHLHMNARAHSLASIDDSPLKGSGFASPHSSTHTHTTPHALTRKPNHS